VYSKVVKKGKAIPVRAWTYPKRSRSLRMLPHFKTIGTWRWHAPEIFLVLIFVRGWFDTRATVWLEGLSR